MLAQLIDFILEHQLLVPSDRTLVAVSGGLDSMVLLDLMAQLNGDIAVAHCNFKLRGAESDGDETFVRKVANDLQIPFFTTYFDTEQAAENAKESIQVTARRLRYEWLQELRAKHNFQKIATAHHQNDTIETFLINFSRGTGLKGLRGIPIENGAVIRPLLFATRHDIAAYAKSMDLQWREDSSNDTLKYTRNLIRHEVVPVLESLNPSFLSGANETIGRLREYEALLSYSIETIKERLLKPAADGSFTIDKAALNALPARMVLCYEFFTPFGFTKEQTQQINTHLTNAASVGRTFKSEKWVVLIDRDDVILQEKTILHSTVHQVYEDDLTLDLPDGTLNLQWLNRAPRTYEETPNIAYLNADKLDFPLTVRHWREGDFFFPLGMNNHRKKLQDFFTDLKLNRFEKHRVWIVSSGKKLVWVVNHRIDNRFRVQEPSAKCLRMEFIGKNRN